MYFWDVEEDKNYARKTGRVDVTMACIMSLDLIRQLYRAREYNLCYVCVCMCVYVVYIYTYACGDQKLMSGIILNCFPPYVLKQTLWLNLKVTNSARWVGY